MNTEIFRVPVVAANKYEALRTLIKDAPATHGGWIELFQKRKTEEGRRGIICRDVYVDPDKFSAHCKARAQATSFKALEDFLTETDPQNNIR